jgi:homoserine kinase
VIKRVIVKVPATIGNLGPGFDCLGLALDLYNEIQVIRNGEFKLNIKGEGKKTLFHDKENLVYKAISTFFAEINQPIPDLLISCYNEIPISRGLGSSAAAIIGGLMVANSLAGDIMTQEQLLQLATSMEAHPDNLTPALFGGCQVVIYENGNLVHRRIPLTKPWRFVLFIPDFKLSTNESRNILSPKIAREDAVYNLGRISLLIKSFITGDTEDLKFATQDRLHQSEREALFPAMSSFFRVAMDSGADGTFLAGGGPTIAALASRYYDAIGKAMLEEGKRLGINGRVSILGLSDDGARIIEAS